MTKTTARVRFSPDARRPWEFKFYAPSGRYLAGRSARTKGEASRLMREWGVVSLVGGW